MFTRRDLLRRHERIVHHSGTNPGINGPRQILDGNDDELSVQPHHETSPVDFRDRVTGHTSVQFDQAHFSLQTPHSPGSSIGIYPLQSPRYINDLCPLSNSMD
jgi:hypothetical protein